jgi:hypothetical protein
MAKEWEQIGGDVNPKEYGAVLARVSGGDGVGSIRCTTHRDCVEHLELGRACAAARCHKMSVEVIRIDPDEAVEHGWFIKSNYFDFDDLTWEKSKGIASFIGANQDDWETMSLAYRAEAALDYGGGGDDSYVKMWSEALPVKSNQIKWWR